MRLTAGKITNAEIVAVISNNEGAYALERAKKHGIPALCIVSEGLCGQRDAFNEALLETMRGMSARI